MKRRVFEAVLAFIGVAVLVGLERPVESVALESFGGVSVPGFEVPPVFAVTEDSVASVHGIRLGMSSREVGVLLKRWRRMGHPLEHCFRSPSGHMVSLGFDNNGRLEHISGCCLEIDGQSCLVKDDYDNDTLALLLGSPDSAGWLGLGCCDIPMGGLRFEAIDTTVGYSPGSLNIALVDEQRWIPEENLYD